MMGLGREPREVISSDVDCGIANMFYFSRNYVNCKALKMHMLFHLATGASSCEAEVLTCMLILKRPSNIAGYIKLIKNRFSCLCWPNTHLKSCLNYQGQPQWVMHQSFFQSFDRQELKENPISISTNGNKQTPHITWDSCSSQGYARGLALPEIFAGSTTSCSRRVSGYQQALTAQAHPQLDFKKKWHSTKMR